MSFEMIVGLDVRDEDGYAAYRKAMIPILTRYGGGFRYDFVIAKVLKTAAEHPINRVFAIYFPDRDVSTKFFADPEYLKEARHKFFESAVNARTLIAEYERP